MCSLDWAYVVIYAQIIQLHIRCYINNQWFHLPSDAQAKINHIFLIDSITFY